MLVNNATTFKVNKGVSVIVLQEIGLNAINGTILSTEFKKIRTTKDLIFFPTERIGKSSWINLVQSFRDSLIKTDKSLYHGFRRDGWFIFINKSDILEIV